MYKLLIKDIDTVSAAIQWCTEQNLTNWDLTTRWPSEGYMFVFNNKSDLTNFALKWM